MAADPALRPGRAELPEGLSRSDVEGLFRQMCVIRRTEERLLALFSEGELSGTTHTSIGQEAIAVAVAAHLETGDAVFSSHRCHGHAIATGAPLPELFAEIMGRDSALCGGRGGSQHLHHGDFYSNGVQGGVVGNATGMALAEKLKDSGRVSVGFMGDGTLGEGLVYESLNFASLQDLPLLLVLEHNGYSQSTPSRLGVAGSPLARAPAFGIESDEVTTNDAVELWTIFRERLRHVREQQRPFLQIVHTYRLAAHSKGDDDREPAEIEAWRDRDPLVLLRSYLPADTAEALETEACRAVEEAAAAARSRPEPPAASAAPLVAVPDEPFPVPWPTAAEPCVEAINRGLSRILESAPTAVLLGEDVLDPYGGAFKATKGLSTRFPGQVITTPLSEAGIVAWSTGAAMRGARAVAEIMFGDFLTLAADQIVNHAAKYRWIYGEGMGLDLVVRTPMGGRRGYGPTHSQSLESVFTGVPGLCVVAASHLLDPGELLHRAATRVGGPVLFVENKLLYGRRMVPCDGRRAGELFVRGASDACFPTIRLGLADDPPDAAVICYGGSTPIALEAAQTLLLEHELLCDIVTVSQLAPLPVTDIAGFTAGAERVVVLEEGPVRGGWGGEVVAALVERGPPSHQRFRRVGAPDSPIPSSRALEEAILPSVGAVVDAVLERSL